ncbi:hypothetical protein KC19_10G060300 [Ceratodon purpureus]|uniref:F-box domain-containing protein n=1 Tax=Ceratodon purpureus TaxID=3225 RepID=A0A8T0GK05_CERPU|nr:hypothetical protein KC19_10G060300 [Ceratodon purpureus]
MATLEMESMWKDLPTEILENVFTFLPISSLCRFRTLSKSWNIHITSYAFRHAQASRSVSPEQYVDVCKRSRAYLRGGWDVLDMAKRRFLFFSDNFVRNPLLQRRPLSFGGNLRGYLEGAAGGLFCVEYIWSDSLENVLHTGLFVCNPVLKTFKELPHLAAKSSLCIVMSTDTVSMGYEIIAHVSNYESPTSTVSIFVYESKIGSWRALASYKLMTQIGRMNWGAMTVFKNKQYWTHIYNCCERIVSYDKETGVVSYLAGLDMSLYDRTTSVRGETRYLVVSQDRLFSVMQVKHGETFLSVNIFEINIAKEERIHLTEVPRELLVWVLPNLESSSMYFAVVTGSADSILISSVGRCAAYSLSNKSWYQCPDGHNLLEDYGGAGQGIGKFNGCSCCLSFCSP